MTNKKKFAMPGATRNKASHALMKFMGYQLVRIGYFGEPDETAWQRKNEALMDRLGMTDVGFYYVCDQDFYRASDIDPYCWNWLMLIVAKVESIYDEFHGYFGVSIYCNSCTIQGTNLRTDPDNFHPAYLSDTNSVWQTKEESTLYNLYQFVLWFNGTLEKNA